MVGIGSPYTDVFASIFIAACRDGHGVVDFETQCAIAVLDDVPGTVVVVVVVGPDAVESARREGAVPALMLRHPRGEQVRVVTALGPVELNGRVRIGAGELHLGADSVVHRRACLPVDTVVGCSALIGDVECIGTHVVEIIRGLGCPGREIRRCRNGAFPHSRQTLCRCPGRHRQERGQQ